MAAAYHTKCTGTEPKLIGFSEFVKYLREKKERKKVALTNHQTRRRYNTITV